MPRVLCFGNTAPVPRKPRRTGPARFDRRALSHAAEVWPCALTYPKRPRTACGRRPQARRTCVGALSLSLIAYLHRDAPKGLHSRLDSATYRNGGPTRSEVGLSAPAAAFAQEISLFTNASKRRLLFTARNFSGMEIMRTLTYPAQFPTDGRAVKNHWRRIRQRLVRNGANCGLWVLEFRERGAPHFHVFLQNPIDRHALARAWCRIVASADPKHLVAGTRIERFRHPLPSVATS